MSQDGVERMEPTDAVVSVVVLDPEKHDVSTVEAVWGNFCHQVYFFPSRQEAEEWATGRDDIAILSVDEAYELGKQVIFRAELLCIGGGAETELDVNHPKNATGCSH